MNTFNLNETMRKPFSISQEKQQPPIVKLSKTF